MDKETFSSESSTDTGTDLLETGQVVEAVLRADRILRSVAGRRTPVRVKTLAKDLGIPRSSAGRIVQSLCSLGYLQRVSGGYVSGHAILELAGLVNTNTDLTKELSGIISELALTVGETAKLSVLVGDEVEVIAVAESPRSHRIAVDVGARFCLHAGAASKTILAFLPRDQRERYLSGPLPRITDRTITNREELETILTRVRKRGYAVDVGEHEWGIRAVAAPVFGAGREVVAALSIPYFDRQPDMSIAYHERLIGCLLQFAQKASLRLGSSFPYSTDVEGLLNAPELHRSPPVSSENA